MSVVGIVSEYNPFHNGHKYHLEKSKELCSSDCVVCVMSGNFIQRGEPAIIDKWSRAEMALMSGADLVVELPSVYAMASAEFFAYGAVKILDSMGIIDYICFGSEAGNLEQIGKISRILSTEPEDYKSDLKAFLNEGLSFPASREKALSKWFDGPENQQSIQDIVKNSNNILAIEYIKALHRLKSRIIPKTIKRESSTYNSEVLEGCFSSATSIRSHIAEEYYNRNSGMEPPKRDFSLEALAETIPESSLSIIKREFQAGRGPVFPDMFENIILSALRRMSTDEIALLPYIAEGLENRIKTAANSSGNLDMLLNAVCTKRYTRTRIKRSLFSIITGVSAGDLSLFNQSGGPQYIRVLGFNSKGRMLLSEINSHSSLPVIVKTADFKSSDNPLISKMLSLEASSTDQYVLAFSSCESRKAGQEYTRNIIYI